MRESNWMVKLVVWDWFTGYSFQSNPFHKGILSLADTGVMKYHEPQKTMHKLCWAKKTQVRMTIDKMPSFFAFPPSFESHVMTFQKPGVFQLRSPVEKTQPCPKTNDPQSTQKCLLGEKISVCMYIHLYVYKNTGICITYVIEKSYSTVLSESYSNSLNWMIKSKSWETPLLKPFWVAKCCAEKGNSHLGLILNFWGVSRETQPCHNVPTRLQLTPVVKKPEKQCNFDYSTIFSFTAPGWRFWDLTSLFQFLGWDAPTGSTPS